MHFPMLAPIFASISPEHRTQYLWPCSRGTVPVACSIAVMPPDLGQQTKYKPARRGGCGCGTETALGKRYLAAHGYPSAPPLSRNLGGHSGDCPDLPSPRARRGGWASTSVRCKVSPRSQHAHLLLPCLTCVCVRVHICPCFTFRPEQPAHLQGPALLCRGGITTPRGLGSTRPDRPGRLCFVLISCPRTDTDATLASDSQEAGPYFFATTCCCTCGFDNRHMSDSNCIPGGVATRDICCLK